MIGRRRGQVWRSRVSPAIVALSAAMLGAGCGGGDGKSAPAGTPEAVQKGGTVTVVGAYDPTTLNSKNLKSTGGGIMAAVWRGVWRTRPDFQFELNSELVTSAEMVSTDPQTIVYKIHPQAVWSDGVPVDADDFIYNWETTRPGATDIDGSRIQSNVGTGSPDPIASVAGSDGGKTVTVVWKAHNVEWKSGAMFNQLVPAHIARRVGFNSGFDRFDPAVQVSITPFRLASYNPGKDATLVRNERYWGTPANLDSVVFRFTTEDAAVGAFKNGEGDMVEGHALPDVVSQLESLPGITTTVFASLSQEALLFNQRNALLAVPDVRKAMALALDRRAIYERVVSKGSTPGVANSFLWANSQPNYRDTSGGRYDRPDVPGAKRLLEGAGFALGPDGVYAKDGKRLSFRIRAVAEAPHDDTAELVQAQLKPVGIELRIENLPPGVFGPQFRSGDFDLAINSYGKNQFGTINLGPGSVLAAAMSYANSRLDQLMQTGHSELDESKRLAAIEQGDRMLWDDLPLLPLYQQPSLVAVRDTFVNIGPNPAGGPFWNIALWARKGGG